MKLLEIQPGIGAVSLNAAERNAIFDATAEATTSATSESLYLDDLANRSRDLPTKLSGLQEVLADFVGRKSFKVLTIGAVNLGEVPEPTPVNHVTKGPGNIYPADVIRGFILGMADLYGYGYATQQQGTVHNNIVPIKEHAQTVGHNASSTYELGLHNEVASFNLGEGLDISPDFLSLHFFRNRGKVPTTVSFPDWDKLPASTIDELQKPWFHNPISPAHTQGGAVERPEVKVSVLYANPNDPWIRISTSQPFMANYSPSRQAALGNFVDHLESRRTDLAVAAGTIALIDNRRVLHGRPAFVQTQAPKYDGSDRWQRRVVASASKARIQKFEVEPRVVDTNKFMATAVNKQRVTHD